MSDVQKAASGRNWQMVWAQERGIVLRTSKDFANTPAVQPFEQAKALGLGISDTPLRQHW
jgi:hypothetical protein